MKNEFDYLNDVKMDFSEYENLELTDWERESMKKILKKNTGKKVSAKRCIAAAACAAAMLAVISQTAFAQELVAKIVQSISTGHNSFVTYEEENTPQSVPVPDELKGQVFDKNGNMLTKISNDITQIYDKDGNEVIICSKFDGDEAAEISLERVKKADEIPESGNGTVVYTSINDISAVLNFALKTPEYLPEGYSLLYAEAFSDNSGNISGDYASLCYSNNKKMFFIHERVSNENTRFTSSGNYTEGEVNGHTAALAKNEASWEADGISISIIGRDALSDDKLLNVAKSIK